MNSNSTTLNAQNTENHDDIVQSSLDFVREYLGMDVAYLSEFVGDKLIFRRVSAPGLDEIISAGRSFPLDQAYCPHVLAGRLPELIPDSAAEPFAQTLAATKEFPIGSHVTVPIQRNDGSTYGMFCCFSKQAKPALNKRDHDLMRGLARIASGAIDERITKNQEKGEIKSRILSAMSDEALSIVYQPIIDADFATIRGYEALSRFGGDLNMPPNLWFLDAAKVDLQVDLEIYAINQALQALTHLPESVYISVNASPVTVQSGRLTEVLSKWPNDRIVLELTEHEVISDYDELMREIDFLRHSRVRIAIDDAGVGYSGLQQILKLKPDLIKLDMALIRDIDADIVKKSLVIAMLQFAEQTSTLVVAEGIETDKEFETLKSMQVDLMQGYFIGRPMPLSDATSL
ncbi:MAG: EAL domain-containing protein [Yoonia sp.]|uniref:EAL domain-containing protein n=1 Tax=Yoonia sp. TaxID=2212373 RepID=UPI003EF10C07